MCFAAVTAMMSFCTVHAQVTCIAYLRFKNLHLLGIVSAWYKSYATTPVLCSKCRTDVGIKKHDLSAAFDDELLAVHTARQHDMLLVQRMDGRQHLFTIFYTWLTLHIEVCI
jgi:hypothetical protein